MSWPGNYPTMAQRRVMAAIEACRTAALGGHVDRCEDCGETHIAYNSCLMGKFRNGESGRDLAGGLVRGKGAASLQAHGYSAASTVRYLRAAAHLGHFLERQGRTLADIDRSTAAAFFRHFPACRCPLSNGEKRNHHTYFGAKRYRAYLIKIAVCRPDTGQEISEPEPAAIAGFRRWLQKHRGVAEATIRQYSRGAVELMIALGGDPAHWQAEDVRAYFIERVGRGGISTAEKLITSIRAFLRYLSLF